MVHIFIFGSGFRPISLYYAELGIFEKRDTDFARNYSIHTEQQLLYWRRTASHSDSANSKSLWVGEQQVTLTRRTASISNSANSKSVWLGGQQVNLTRRTSHSGSANSNSLRLGEQQVTLTVRTASHSDSVHKLARETKETKTILFCLFGVCKSLHFPRVVLSDLVKCTCFWPK